MNKETRELFNALNDNMDEWDKAGVKPKAVEMYEDMLSDFYEKIGKNPKDDRFNTRLKLTPEQEDELLDIAQSMANNTYTYDETYADVYNKYKDRYGWSDVSEAVDFLETMEKYRSDSLLREVLSSEQIMELYSEANSQGLSDDDIEQMIYLEYSMSGASGEKLFNAIQGAIINYDEGLEGWR